jgi:hypothetical protein
MPFARALPVLLALLLLPGFATAATLKWVGGTSDDWHEPSNWDPAGVPKVGDQAIVFNLGFQPVVVTANTEIRDLIVDEGADLRVGTGITLQVDADLTNKGTVSGTGPFTTRLVYAGTSLANHGTISLPAVEFAGTGFQNVSGAGAWTGLGIFVDAASVLVPSNDITLGPSAGGPFVVRVMGELIVDVGLTLTLESAQLIVGEPFLAPGVVTGAGTLRTQGASELQLNAGTYGVPLLVASGVTRVTEALIPIDASILVEGTFDLLNNVVLVTGFPFHVSPGGVLRGSETAMLPASALVNRGRIEPGASPGRLVVEGALNQQVNGAIEIEIAGIHPVTEHDRLVVTGNFKMRDTLRVVMIGPYTPNVGDQFHVLSFGSRNATFQRIVVVPGNPYTMPQFAPIYDDTSLTLVVTAVVDVAPGNEQLLAPTRTVLFAPEPNPAAERTAVRFELASRSPVRLEVFDAAGRRVRVLADETLDTGRHRRTWDGLNQQGDRVVPGVYLLRLEAGPLRETQRIVLIGG